MRRSKSATRNRSRASRSSNRSRANNNFNDTFDPTRMDVAGNNHEEEDLSVEPNPTVRRRTNPNKPRLKAEHCECDLCDQEEEVFWKTSKPLSNRGSSVGRRSSRGRNSQNLERVSYHEDDLSPERNGSFSRSSLKRSKGPRSSGRKSVSFKELIDEFNPNYSIYREGRGAGNRSINGRRSNGSSSIARSASFGNADLDDDTADFDEIEFTGSIPAEGKKSLVRGSRFSASKNITRAGTHSYYSPQRAAFTTKPDEYRYG